jgi:hypothetical protein
LPNFQIAIMTLRPFERTARFARETTDWLGITDVDTRAAQGRESTAQYAFGDVDHGHNTMMPAPITTVVLSTPSCKSRWDFAP